MQTIKSTHQNTNDFEPTTSNGLLYSGSVSKALATPMDFLGSTKTFFDSEYLTFTSSKLQNGQLMPTNFARDMEMPTKCFVCGQPTNCCHYDVPSCNGCKSFFRRSLFEYKTYACKHNGMCNIMNGPVFEETIEDKIIQSLVYVELKVKKIRESSRWLSESVIFRSIRELLESNHENVLAHADQYPKELKWPLTIDEAARFEEIEKQKPHNVESPTRTGFRPESATDQGNQAGPGWQIQPQPGSCRTPQEALLKQAVLANAFLLQAFYSYQMKSETFIMPNGFLPMMTMEEFVLLKAIIYSHSAIHGLSERGRVLLEKESIRYSKTLMKHLQSRMGAAPGAKKYADIVSFVDCLFHCAQQQREIHVYMSTVLRPPGVHDCPSYMETIMYA
ncbi:zinc finger, c4 type (two domains) domain-containing protein [Ditylenchus destructor]|nr:zinc finger, c4 type (two domains) domain-containing protein [Ditylenchus destructor]